MPVEGEDPLCGRSYGQFYFPREGAEELKKLRFNPYFTVDRCRISSRIDELNHLVKSRPTPSGFLQTFSGTNEPAFDPRTE